MYSDNIQKTIIIFTWKYIKINLTRCMLLLAVKYYSYRYSLFNVLCLEIIFEIKLRKGENGWEIEQSTNFFLYDLLDVINNCSFYDSR